MFSEIAYDVDCSDAIQMWTILMWTYEQKQKEK